MIQREIAQRLTLRAFALLDEARDAVVVDDGPLADRISAVEAVAGDAVRALGRLESHEDYLVAGYLLGRIQSLCPPVQERSRLTGDVEPVTDPLREVAGF